MPEGSGPPVLVGEGAQLGDLWMEGYFEVGGPLSASTGSIASLREADHYKGGLPKVGVAPYVDPDRNRTPSFTRSAPAFER